jgi:hypothetical protein
MSVLANTLPGFVPSYEAAPKGVPDIVAIAQPQATELPYAQKAEPGEGSRKQDDTAEQHKAEAPVIKAGTKVVSVQTDGAIHRVYVKAATGDLLAIPFASHAHSGAYQLPHEIAANDKRVPELFSTEV